MTDQLKLFDPNASLPPAVAEVAANPAPLPAAEYAAEDALPVMNESPAGEAGDLDPPDLPPSASGPADDIPSPADYTAHDLRRPPLSRIRHERRYRPRPALGRRRPEARAAAHSLRHAPDGPLQEPAPRQVGARRR